MKVEEFLAGLDSLYSDGRIAQAEGYLKKGLEEAAMDGDAQGCLTVFNELMGYYRTASRHSECMVCIRQAAELADMMGIRDTAAYGTTLLNAATGLRAAGRYEEAESCYRQAGAILKEHVEEPDYRLASLHNNLGILYSMMGRLEESGKELQNALDMLVQLDGIEAETAVTHTNLGNVCFQCGDYLNGAAHMRKAVAIFESRPDEKDAHYAAALSGLGEACFHEGHLEEAESCYEKALREIESAYGKNDDFYTVSKNLEAVRGIRARRQALQSAGIKGLELSKRYYEAFGRPMLNEKYPEYAKRAAVGLVGEGSECMGFDDIYSTDHDYGPGFCIWLPDEDYAAVGAQMQGDYEKLPDGFLGFPKRDISEHGKKRVGVFSISGFYERLTGHAKAPAEEAGWEDIPLEAVCAAVNGEVFEDPLGEFTKRRQGFLDYPEPLRLKKLAQALGKMAQAGQYNYGRSKKRGDIGAMFFSLFVFADATLDAAYAMNFCYPPFYKWKMHGVEHLPHGKKLKELLEGLFMTGMENTSAECRAETGTEANTKNNAEIRIEKICREFADWLRRQGLCQSGSSFLEVQKEELLECLENTGLLSGRDARIQQIVKLEWAQFQKVQNEGGRADCQDDRDTFDIMRKSQFLTWDIEMLNSYLSDIRSAEEDGRNLLEEKYARMMADTAPEQYAEIAAKIPGLDRKQMQLREDILCIEIGQADALAALYPKLMSRGRSIHTVQGMPGAASAETYLKGELSTYSVHTLECYRRMLKQYENSGESRVEANLRYMARFYGYDSLEQAEKEL